LKGCADGTKAFCFVAHAHSETGRQQVESRLNAGDQLKCIAEVEA
jgi:hypothetical protein